MPNEARSEGALVFAERDCEGSPMPNPLEARFRRWFASFTDAELNTEAVGDALRLNRTHTPDT